MKHASRASANPPGLGRRPCTERLTDKTWRTTASSANLGPKPFVALLQFADQAGEQISRIDIEPAQRHCHRPVDLDDDAALRAQGVHGGVCCRSAGTGSHPIHIRTRLSAGSYPYSSVSRSATFSLRTARPRTSSAAQRDDQSHTPVRPSPPRSHRSPSGHDLYIAGALAHGRRGSHVGARRTALGDSRRRGCGSNYTEQQPRRDQHRSNRFQAAAADSA